MTTYACPAACAHCLYASSPKTRGRFMDAQTARMIASNLKRMGAHSVHIGGGEPFLHMPALRATIDALREANIGIDYIETNAFWARNIDRAREIIRALGAPIMVSVDPFHVEYIALSRPLSLIRLLEEMRWDHFVWQDRYIPKLLPLDHARPIPRASLEAHLGNDYRMETAREYGLSANGRALTILRESLPRQRAEELLDDRACRLLNGVHCHIDHFGNFVPPGCPGIAISIRDLAAGAVDPATYPVATRLMAGGVRALWDYAIGRGFAPDAAGYVTKCELCYFMRDFLSQHHPTPDIAPDCFYESMRESYAQHT